MEFQSKPIPESRDYVADFLEELDDETAFKILEKLEERSQRTALELERAEHIKKIEGDVWEARVRIKREQYRFLGYKENQNFWMVHAVQKKTAKLRRKDINVAIRRIEIIKYNENK